MAPAGKIVSVFSMFVNFLRFFSFLGNSNWKPRDPGSIRLHKGSIRLHKGALRCYKEAIRPPKISYKAIKGLKGHKNGRWRTKERYLRVLQGSWLPWVPLKGI